MQKIIAYPVVFKEYHDDGDYFVASCLDVQGFVTDGATLPETMVHAQEALGTILLDVDNLPKASDLKDVQKVHPDDTVLLIAADLEKARKESLSIKQLSDGKFAAIDGKGIQIAIADTRDNLDQILDHYKLHYTWCPC